MEQLVTLKTLYFLITDLCARNIDFGTLFDLGEEISDNILVKFVAEAVEDRIVFVIFKRTDMEDRE